MQAEQAVSLIEVLQSELGGGRQRALQRNAMVLHHDVVVLSVDEDVEGLANGMCIMLHRILHEYLYRHREDEIAVVLQFFLYLEYEMARMSDVEQVAVLSDESDFLGDGDGLLVELVHDIAVDGGELQCEGLGKLRVFADEFGERAEAVEHEMWVELELQEFLLHLHVAMALSDDDSAVVEAEIDDGEQSGDGGEHIETVPEDVVASLIDSVHHALEADGDEHVGDEHRPTMQEELGIGWLHSALSFVLSQPPVRRSFAAQGTVEQKLADEIGDGERHQHE